MYRLMYSTWRHGMRTCAGGQIVANGSVGNSIRPG